MQKCILCSSKEVSNTDCVIETRVPLREYTFWDSLSGPDRTCIILKCSRVYTSNVCQKVVLCRINPSCRPQRIKVASGDINVNVVGIQFVLWNICRHIATYRLTYSKYSCYSLRLLHNFRVIFNSLKKVFVKCASSSLQHFLRFIRTCNFPSMLGTSDEALHSSKGSGPDSDTHPRGVLNGFIHSEPIAKLHFLFNLQLINGHFS